MKKYTNKLILILVIYFVALTSLYAKDTLQLVISGINGAMLTNVQNRLKAEQDLLGADLDSEKITTLNRMTPTIVRKAIEPYGYFKPIINSTSSHAGSVWIINVSVQPGIPLRITDIKYSIQGAGKNTPALQTIALHRGDIFNSEAYEKAKEKLFETANNEGYIKAVLTENKVLVNIKENSAVIIIVFETGPQYYFGPVSFGDSAYDSSFLRRFINFKENEHFSSQKLITLQQDMSAAAYFQQVIATPDFEHAKDFHVPITINVTAPKSQKYNLGLGYGTFTGPRLTAGLSLRRITDTGHHFDTQLTLSPVLSSITGKYYIPGNNPLTDQWVIGIDYQRFNPKEASSVSETLFGGYETKIYDIKTNVTLNYLFERYKIENKSTENSKILYPNLDLSYVNVDNLINPHSGYMLNYNIRGSTQALLSTTSFGQTELKGKYLYNPFSFARIIFRGDLGYSAVHDINQWPASLRFYAGELNGLRGYSDSGIGPGRYLAIGSIEYQNRIKGDFYAGIILDAGKATNHFGSPFYKGEGVGLIYESIIGPVRLYVTRAVTLHNRPTRIDFSIGPEF